MKNCLLILLIFCFKSSFSQLNDNFNDGNFTNAPVWSGSNSGNDFTIVSNRLRSNSTTTNTNFYLSTPNSLANNCTWEFYCNLQFATSGSNYVDIYLIADKADLQSSSINGYFVRIGNTNDEISLYKRSGSMASSVMIIDGANLSVNSTTNNLLKIKVSRTANYQFTLARDITGTGSSFFNEGLIVDSTFKTSAFFGLYVKQSTASFTQKHFFDDFLIQQLIVDTSPPKLLSATAIDTLTVEAVFDEALDSTIAKQATNYLINNSIGNPVNVSTTIDPARYRLTLSKSLNTASYLLTTTSIEDKFGNVISANNSISFNFIKPYTAKAGDIVINELFADPTPPVSLPGFEFLELWNTTAQTISFKDWQYSDLTTNFKFAKDSILPNEYLILCAKTDTNEFKKYGRVIGISPWPSLNNTNDKLTLKNNLGTIISQVSYSDNWYKDAVKKSGGWSLELINPQSTCSGIQNWNSSVNFAGGTPAQQNSVYNTHAFVDPLKIVSAELIDSITIKVQFNRYIDSLTAAQSHNYSLNNGVDNPAIALPLSPLFEQVILTFAEPLVRGNNFKLTLSNITDCAGMLISPLANSAEFFYPKKIVKNAVLINEVLFNPRLNGVDFVEIYNHSEDPVDLKDLSIANTAKDIIANVKRISLSPLIMQPKQYYVLTTDPENIKKEYRTENPDAFIKLPSMPSYNNDAGNVVLISNNVLIDQLAYNEKMHFPLIKDYEGVSLERVSFSKETNVFGNFQSAAAIVGYATPGYKNSQSVEDIKPGNELTLTSKTFSPDNDGFEDFLQINYHFTTPGLVFNATIYNDKGVLIKRLAKNLTLNAEGFLTWDGMNEQTQPSPIGIYLLYAETFDTKGNVKKYRKTFALAGKL